MLSENMPQTEDISLPEQEIVSPIERYRSEVKSAFQKLKIESHGGKEISLASSVDEVLDAILEMVLAEEDVPTDDRSEEIINEVLGSTDSGEILSAEQITGDVSNLEEAISIDKMNSGTPGPEEEFFSQAVKVAPEQKDTKKLSDSERRFVIYGARLALRELRFDHFRIEGQS